MVCNGLLWSVMVCNGLLWSVMVCYGLLGCDAVCEKLSSMLMYFHYVNDNGFDKKVLY